MTRLLCLFSLAVLLGLSGCGKKGPLDPPPGYENQEEDSSR